MGTKAIEGFKRVDAFQGAPDAFTIVGVTVPGQPGDVGFDAASNAVVIGPDYPLVQSIRLLGFRGAIVVTKVGDRHIVTSGRKRVRAACIVDAERRAKGLPGLVITATREIPAGSNRDAEVAMTTYVLNQLQHRASVADTVREAGELHRLSVSDAVIAAIYHVREPAVRDWLRVYELAPQAQTAFFAGELKLSVALQLHGLAEPKQLARLEAIREQRATGKRVSATPPRPGKKTVRRELERYAVSSDFRRGVEFALGDLGAAEAFVGFALVAPDPVAKMKGRRS